MTTKELFRCRTGPVASYLGDIVMELDYRDISEPPVDDSLYEELARVLFPDPSDLDNVLHVLVAFNWALTHDIWNTIDWERLSDATWNQELDAVQSAARGTMAALRHYITGPLPTDNVIFLPVTVIGAPL